MSILENKNLARMFTGIMSFVCGEESLDGEACPYINVHGVVLNDDGEVFNCCSSLIYLKYE